MVERTVTIQNEHGIHCRPSAIIVKATQRYPGEVTLKAPSGETDARSVIGLLTINLQRGTPVTVRVEGPDEDAFCKTLAGLLEYRYDFPPREPGDTRPDRASAEVPMPEWAGS